MAWALLWRKWLGPCQTKQIYQRFWSFNCWLYLPEFLLWVSKFLIFISVIQLNFYIQNEKSWREIETGRTMTFAGWGSTDKIVNKTVLQYGISTIISREECSRSTSAAQLFICTKNPSHSDTDTLVGTCSGDSGGMLVLTI